MNILVVQTGFLGDVILSSAVYPNVRRLYPRARLTVLTTPQAADIVRHHPDVDSVITFDKRGEDRGVGGMMRIAAQIRAERFDLVFSLHKSYRTALLLWLAGVPTRFGFREAKLRFLYSNTVPRSDLEHDVLRNLAIFRNVGHEPDSLVQHLLIGIPDAVQREVDTRFGFSRNGSMVAIAPGSVWATKRWMPIGFAKVAEELIGEGFRVCLIGGPDDAAIAHCIKNTVPGVDNLVGQTSLLESAAVVKRASLVICNDSAPLHMASATGTPVVALFCATSPTFGYGPWQVPSHAIGVQGLSCRPCRRHGANHCPTGTHACQRNLSPDVVLKSSLQLLEQTSDDVPATDSPGAPQV